LGWLAGLYYGRESVHASVQFHFFDGYVGSFATPDGTPLYGFDEYNSFDQIKTSKAAFLNAHFDVAPTVTLRAGVRFTHDDISIDNFYALEGGLTGPSTGFAPDGGTTLWTQTIPYSTVVSYNQFSSAYTPQAGLNPTLGQNNNNVSFKAGADWKPADDLLVYGSFSQGYRGAAFNGQAFNAPAELNFAAPEKLNAYEIGMQSQWWNRRAEFNVAAFHYDYRNQQFLDAFALPGGAGTGFHTVNAPKSRIDGAEFEARAQVTPDLQLRAGLGLLHTKYVELTLHGVDSRAIGSSRRRIMMRVARSNGASRAGLPVSSSCCSMAISTANSTSMPRIRSGSRRASMQWPMAGSTSRVPRSRDLGPRPGSRT
jgi:iron complex outermembrane recepter protein